MKLLLLATAFLALCSCSHVYVSRVKVGGTADPAGDVGISGELGLSYRK